MQNDRPTAGGFGPTVFSLFCEWVVCFFFPLALIVGVSPSPTLSISSVSSSSKGWTAFRMQTDRRDAFRPDPFLERQGDLATEVPWHSPQSREVVWQMQAARWSWHLTLIYVPQEDVLSWDTEALCNSLWFLQANTCRKSPMAMNTDRHVPVLALVMWGQTMCKRKCSGSKVRLSQVVHLSHSKKDKEVNFMEARFCLKVKKKKKKSYI